MKYCSNCGQEITEDSVFCIRCGAPLEKQVVTSIVPTAFDQELDREEREFLETTHRLLRWEHKAWKIASTVFTIMGIVFSVLYMLVFFIGVAIVADGDSSGTALMILGFMYTLIFGGMFIAYGIISKIAGKKLLQYINSLYTDISLTYNRCGSIGMMIFTIIFGVVSPIFFIINFVRMKACRSVIERIMRNQNVQSIPF